jgi:hypothetical protein
VVDFQVAEVVEDDYGLSMIALSNDTGNILTLTRSDPLQAEGYLEINGDRYSLIQFKDKLLIVNAKGFFKVPTGDHDDIAIPPVNIVE